MGTIQLKKKSAFLWSIGVMLMTTGLFAGEYQIVMPKQNCGSQTLAVSELIHHLKCKASEIPYRFVFARPSGTPPSRPFESRYLVKDDTVWFWGDDGGSDQRAQEDSLNDERNGSLFAVELFAERELGMRFVWPGKSGVVVKHVKVLKLRDGAEGTFVTPDAYGYIRNYLSYIPRPWIPDGVLPAELYRSKMPNTYEDRDLWRKRNRLQVRYKINYGHAFTKWKERFGESHPEYLNLTTDPDTKKKIRGYTRGGNPRYTKHCVSNEDVVDEIIANWKASGCPKYLNVCENDAGNWCECEKCCALDVAGDGEARYSFMTDRYVNFWNRIARKACAIRSDVMLVTYLYSAYRYPPRREKLEFGGNMLCGFVCGELGDAVGMIREWKDVGLRHFFFRPNYLHIIAGFHRGYERYFYDQVHELLRQGMYFADYDANNNRPMSSLEFYVLARVFADHSVSFDEIMDDYASAYGAAAKEVKEYYAAVRETGEAQRTGLAKARLEGIQMDYIPRERGLSRQYEYGRTEEDFRAKKAILTKALSRHVKNRDLTKAEFARLSNLELQAEHGLLTYRFMSSVRRLSDREVVERGNALTAFRIAHQDDMPDFYNHVYQLPRPEGYYWAEFREACVRMGKAKKDLPKTL